MSSLFRSKGSSPLYIFSHLICKGQCCNCNITYYGQSERHLKVRAGEHKSTSTLSGKNVKNNKKSFFKYHYFLSGHLSSFDGFSKLNYESHKFKRLINESLLITKDNLLLNKPVNLLKLELF